MSAYDIQSDNVLFTADAGLTEWIEKESGRPYLFSELESIARQVRASMSGSVSRVEMYGVSETGRVYVKLFNGTGQVQEEWSLFFRGGAAQFSRISE